MCFMKLPMILLMILMTFMSCINDDLKVNIKSIKVIDDVPGASGIFKVQNKIYIIGDNSPYLFEYNNDLNLLSKTKIFSTENLNGNTIDKAIKPDFEALGINDKNELIAFGSGSKSPQRDLFIKVSLSDSVQVETLNITHFYNSLRQLDVLKNRELNIEAVTFFEGNIYLFNRDGNIIFCFVYKELIESFKDFNVTLQPKIVQFELPKIMGIQAGFSGATLFNEKPAIIFTASVENTDNAYDDGEILGSFVGIINIQNNELSSTVQHVLIPKDEEALKIESVVIDGLQSNNYLNVILVTDSDGGKSKALRCDLIMN